MSVMDDRCCVCGETRAQHLARKPQWQCGGGRTSRFVAVPKCPRCDSADKVDRTTHPAFFLDGSSAHMCNGCGIGFKVDIKGRSLF
jgi:hypothetical protein